MAESVQAELELLTLLKKSLPSRDEKRNSTNAQALLRSVVYSQRQSTVSPNLKPLSPPPKHRGGTFASVVITSVPGGRSPAAETADHRGDN